MISTPSTIIVLSTPKKQTPLPKKAANKIEKIKERARERERRRERGRKRGQKR